MLIDGLIIVRAQSKISWNLIFSKGKKCKIKFVTHEKWGNVMMIMIQVILP